MATPLRLHLEAFAKFSRDDCALIDRMIDRVVREVPARRDIIREGEKPRGVKVVLDGWACRYKQLPDGRRQIVSFFIPGDLCDSKVFILEDMDHSIAAITPVRYAEISPSDFDELLSECPRVTEAFWWNELVHAAIAREWILNIGQRTALERVAHIFCEMYIRLKVVGLCDNGICFWPLTQTDLAEAAGLTAVHVNRMLQELRRQKLIELDGRRLTIPDVDALQTVALFNPNYLHLGREGRHLDAND